MTFIHIATIVGAGLILAAVPAAAGPAAPIGSQLAKSGTDVEQVRYYRGGGAFPAAIIGGVISGVVGGAVGDDSCYYNDCGYDDDDGYVGGGYVGGGYRGGGHGGGRPTGGGHASHAGHGRK